MASSVNNAANILRKITTNPTIVSISNSTAGKIAKYIVSFFYFNYNLEASASLFLIHTIISSLRSSGNTEAAQKKESFFNKKTIKKFTAVAAGYFIFSRTTAKVIFASLPFILQHSIRLSGIGLQIVLIYKITQIFRDRQAAPTPAAPTPAAPTPAAPTPAAPTPAAEPAAAEPKEEIELTVEETKQAATDQAATDQATNTRTKLLALVPILASTKELLSYTSNTQTLIKNIPNALTQTNKILELLNEIKDNLIVIYDNQDIILTKKVEIEKLIAELNSNIDLVNTNLLNYKNNSSQQNITELNNSSLQLQDILTKIQTLSNEFQDQLQNPEKE